MKVRVLMSPSRPLIQFYKVGEWWEIGRSNASENTFEPPPNTMLVRQQLALNFDREFASRCIETPLGPDTSNVKVPGVCFKNTCTLGRLRVPRIRHCRFVSSPFLALSLSSSILSEKMQGVSVQPSTLLRLRCLSRKGSSYSSSSWNLMVITTVDVNVRSHGTWLNLMSIFMGRYSLGSFLTARDVTYWTLVKSWMDRNIRNAATANEAMVKIPPVEEDSYCSDWIFLKKSKDCSPIIYKIQSIIHMAEQTIL